MRKIIAILIVCLASLSGMWASAQNLEFMGVDLCGSNADTVINTLQERGYEFVGTHGLGMLFDGKFMGYDATVTLVVPDNSEPVQAIMLSIQKLYMESMVSLTADLRKKSEKKYPHYNYEVSYEKGDTMHCFLGPRGSVSVKSCMNVAGKTHTYGIIVYYHTNCNGVENNTNGLDIDDL